MPILFPPTSATKSAIRAPTTAVAVVVLGNAKAAGTTRRAAATRRHRSAAQCAARTPVAYAITYFGAPVVKCTFATAMDSAASAATRSTATRADSQSRAVRRCVPGKKTLVSFGVKHTARVARGAQVPTNVAPWAAVDVGGDALDNASVRRMKRPAPFGAKGSAENAAANRPPARLFSFARARARTKIPRHPPLVAQTKQARR